MQRHRNQRVGLLEQIMTGSRHPAAHRGCQIGAVLVFQRMHQRSRDVVIAYGGAGALIGRRIGDGLHRQHAGTGIVDKGNAEPRAIRRCDERQLGPAICADAFAIDRFAAGDAQRRQRDVERQPRGVRPRDAAGAERAAQVGGDGTGWGGLGVHEGKGSALMAAAQAASSSVLVSPSGVRERTAAYASFRFQFSNAPTVIARSPCDEAIHRAAQRR